MTTDNARLARRFLKDAERCTVMTRRCAAKYQKTGLDCYVIAARSWQRSRATLLRQVAELAR